MRSPDRSLSAPLGEVNQPTRPTHDDPSGRRLRRHAHLCYRRDVPPTPSAPWLSVIVELDNLLHGEISRTRTMLTRLFDQIRENRLEPRVEVLVAYDETALGPHDVHGIVTASTPGETLAVRLVATRGLRYYSLKNEGARQAKGDILLFVDSDCLLEEHWLRRLLESFQNPDVDIVTGNSSIDRDTFYARTFAAGWYFPPRLPDGPLVNIQEPFANNLAMRRHTYDRYPFPEESELYMAQGITWYRTLAAHRIPIFLNPSARVAHPPPVFLRSAIVNGYDTAQRTREPGESKLQSLKVTYRGFRENIRMMARRIIRDHRDVGLSRAAVPAAIALAGVYWTLWSMAELVARWAPRLIPHRHLR
jgi:glycosyl transferase family 2